jgi:hypothetical protein
VSERQIAWAFSALGLLVAAGCATEHKPTYTPSPLALACASDADCVILDEHRCCQCFPDEPFADSRRDEAAIAQMCNGKECPAIDCDDPKLERKERFVAVCVNKQCARRRREGRP